MLAAASAEDTPKTEKSASSPPSRRYDPLIIPQSQDALPAPVSTTQKEISRETGKAAVSAASPETQSGSLLIIPTEVEKDKSKKQSLWIYTLPEEQAAREQQRIEETRRTEQWEESQKARQLPEWAIDPEFRKYFLMPDAGGTSPAAASASGAGLADRNPFGSDRKAKSGPAGSIFSGGASSTSDKESPKKKEEAGFLDKSSGTGDDIVRKNANFDPLYQSNQKQKRVEDFYDGLNKPVEVESSSDRYHKPQKPQ